MMSDKFAIFKYINKQFNKKFYQKLFDFRFDFQSRRAFDKILTYFLLNCLFIYLKITYLIKRGH